MSKKMDSIKFYEEHIKPYENDIYVPQWFDNEDLDAVLDVELDKETRRRFIRYCEDVGIGDEISRLLRDYYYSFLKEEEEESK